MATPLTLIDLFAGCGGMTAGFVRQGFTPVYAVEHNPHAAATYAANFGDHMHCKDIADVTDDQMPDADVIIGGPPCQGFSNLGSRDVNDPRNKLWKQYLRFVQIVRPRVFVIENVERFRRSSEFELLLDETEDGMLAEYELTHGLLLAADYGVAQRRPRTIVIGSRIGRIDLPEPTHDKLAAADRKPWRTVRDRIAGLPAKPTTTELPERTIDFQDRRIPGPYRGRDLHFGRNPRELSLQRYQCIPPGGGRFDLPDELLPRCWREKKSGTTDVMGRMRWEHPSLTIRTEFFKPEKGQYLHPQWVEGRPDKQVNRVITHLEAALLQDFPDDFRWYGSKIEIAKQIGNAVPVGLAEAIAGHLRSRLGTAADESPRESAA